MRKGHKCKEEVLNELKRIYDSITSQNYYGNLLEALENFNYLTENEIRNILNRYYENQKSVDQAWKTCKGALYEYAVFKYISYVIDKNDILKDRLEILIGDKNINIYKDQITIKNWKDIFPDTDLLLIDKKSNSVRAIFSCKTSLRERITETAFWKRELERNSKEIIFIFVTTDKDNELQIETNRYILLHVIDYTFITDPEKYKKLIEIYKRRYGDKENFYILLNKVRFIGEIEKFLLKFFE